MSEAAARTPFGDALARGLARAGWLLAQGLAGRPITMCTSPACRWAHIEHYYADCSPTAPGPTSR